MKALLGATALSLVMLGAGTVPAAAGDINIHVYGDEGVEFGHGPRGKGHGAHMRRGMHPGMERGMHPGMHPGMQYGMRHDGHHGRDPHGRGYGPHGWGHDPHGWRDDDGHPGGRGHHGDWHGGKKGHGRHMARMMELIEHYDRDGDGKVTQAEIDEGRADRLAEFDSDGNGALSLEEYEALWLDAMRERMVDRFQAHDDDGDGEVTVEEFSERTGHLVLRGDRNEDGAIGPEDMRRGDRGGYGMRGEWRRHMMRDEWGRDMMRDDRGRPMMRGDRGRDMMPGDRGGYMPPGDRGHGMMRNRGGETE